MPNDYKSTIVFSIFEKVKKKRIDKPRIKIQLISEPKKGEQRMAQW